MHGPSASSQAGLALRLLASLASSGCQNLIASDTAWALTSLLLPVSMESKSSVAKFPVIIKHQTVPKLYDPGPGKALIPEAQASGLVKVRVHGGLNDKLRLLPPHSYI